jgi:O-antigen ligase
MRFLALLLIVAAVPFFVFLLKRRNGYATCCFLVGILPFIITSLDLNFAIISWPAWPGYAKGLVITVMDSLALAFIISQRGLLRHLPFKGVFATYVISMMFSAFNSASPLAAWFYVFQLVRVFGVFLAVASFTQRPEGLRWLAYGLACAAVLEGMVTSKQRFDGVFQAVGTMSHQNLLGFMLHFVCLPLFAMLLAGIRSKLVAFGLIGALAAVALGASRATVGFLSVGLCLLAMLSLARYPSPRKWKAVGIGAVALILAAPIALSGIQQRLASSTLEGSYNERLAFERAAEAMFVDHPFGVGANQYVIVANVEGYSERAGVIWSQGSRAAHVHNLYLLTAAEAGWLGIMCLVVLFAWPIVRGLRFGLKKENAPRRDIVLGATLALAVAAAHSLYEWIFVIYQAQYVFAVALGIIAGAIRQDYIEVSKRGLSPTGEGVVRESQPSARGLN